MLRCQVKRTRWGRADRLVLAALSCSLPRSDWGRFPVRPETLLRWHGGLVHRTWAAFGTWAVFGRRRGPGRPPLPSDLRAMIARLAPESPTWGCVRLRGELPTLGHDVSASAIRSLLRRRGAPPAPRRAGSARPAPLRAHATGRLACDSFAVETLRPHVLCVRFFGGVKTRRVVLAGGTAPPTAAWVTQQARNLTRALDAAGIRPAVLRHDHSNPRRPHRALRLDPPERPARAPWPPAPAPAVVRRDRRGGVLHDDEAAAA